MATDVSRPVRSSEPQTVKKHDRAESITFASDSRDQFVLHGARLLADFCGLKLVEFVPEDHRDVDVYYGNDESRNCHIRIPSTEYYSVSTIPRLPMDRDFATANDERAKFPFDLFQAMYFWLSDQGTESLPPEAFDIHERLIANHSLQQAVGLREVPIINHYFLLIRWWLQIRCGVSCKSLVPDGKKCVLILSHDVDNPIDPTNVSHQLWLALKSVRQADPRLLLGCLRKSSFALARKVWGCKDRFDLFEDVLRAESRYGFRSTFFFSPVSYVDGHHGLDVLYDVRTPRLRRVMKTILAGDWEIGLHVSYDALRGKDRIAQERKKLELVADCVVRGTRHHYWHVGRPFWGTLEQHERAGLTYDSSLAFNDAPGYRMGIAYPFFPWNPLSHRAIGTLQVPTVFMDGNYFYSPGQTAEDAVDRLQTLFSHLKTSEGVAAIDWHERTAFPGSTAYREWGRAYLLLLERLAADSSIYVCSFSQLMDLWHRRQSSLRESPPERMDPRRFHRVSSAF